MVAKDDLARCWALFDIWWATRLILLGLYWDDCNGLYRDHIGITEKEMETIVWRVHLGENKSCPFSPFQGLPKSLGLGFRV